MTEPKPITFPAPTADWGTVTHVTMRNPNWRWWAFWRPRVILMPLDGGKPIRRLREQRADGTTLTIELH